MRKFITALILLPLAFYNYAQDDGWIALFNGENLDGWNVKITKHEFNNNYKNTFFVEDSILKVSNENYEKFDMQFGHLFTALPYSHYILKLENKFMGKGMDDAPLWTNYNSGVMLHSQPPQSMKVNQGFPVSIEAQFLGEGATAGTQTVNVVSPGTNIELDGKLNTKHINDSRSILYPLNEWVTFEVDVHGNDNIIHRVNGKEVINFSNPILDETDRDAKYLLDRGVNPRLNSGYIALQEEGASIWFRNIKIKILDQ